MFNTDVVLVSLLLTLNIFHFFSCATFSFENVNAEIFPPGLKHVNIQCMTNCYNKVTFFFAKRKSEMTQVQVTSTAHNYQSTKRLLIMYD